MVSSSSSGATSAESDWDEFDYDADWDNNWPAEYTPIAPRSPVVPDHVRVQHVPITRQSSPLNRRKTQRLLCFLLSSGAVAITVAAVAVCAWVWGGSIGTFAISHVRSRPHSYTPHKRAM